MLKSSIVFQPGRYIVSACICAAIFLGIVAGPSQALEPVPKSDDNFGDILVHPRDRHYLPGKAPSRAVRQSVEKVYDAERGTMYRYEYKKGDTTIYRDVWEDPDLGQRGSVGLRFKF